MTANTSAQEGFGRMSNSETLEALAVRCEQATGPDRELDATIWAIIDGYTAIEERNGWIVAVGKGVEERSLGLIDPGQHSRNFTPQHHDMPAYTASLDAAMTLVPEGMDWFRERGVRVPFIVSVDGPTCRFISECDNSLPLALCAAALRARTQSEKDRPNG